MKDDIKTKIDHQTLTKGEAYVLNVINSLHRDFGCTISQLADHVGLSRQTMAIVYQDPGRITISKLEKLEILLKQKVDELKNKSDELGSWIDKRFSEEIANQSNKEGE